MPMTVMTFRFLQKSLRSRSLLYHPGLHFFRPAGLTKFRSLGNTDEHAARVGDSRGGISDKEETESQGLEFSVFNFSSRLVKVDDS